jgi:HTH-type transcriptional regulator/antitoxin HigA
MENCCLQTLPKRIETDEEFDHFVDVMEGLSRAASKRTPDPESETLHSLLAILVKEYDDRVSPLPPADPIRMLKYLMDQRNLRPVDLVPIFGSRSHVSMALNGKRAFSKEQVRKLAEFFRASTDLFL